jgi:hypothetical protein
LEAKIDILLQENQRLHEDLEQRDLQLGSALKKVMRLKSQKDDVKPEISQVEVSVQDPDQELVILCETRLKEIHRLVDEKKVMQQEIDRLMMDQIHHRPNSHDHVEKELRYQISLQDQMKKDLMTKVKDLEILQKTRREFQEQLIVIRNNVARRGQTA